MFLPSASFVCGERLSNQIIGCDHKYAAGLRDVNAPKIPAGRCLAEGNSGTIPAGAIFPRFIENVNHLMFFHLVVMNVRRARRRIYVESGHRCPASF
jgi:hypothetical protein